MKPLNNFINIIDNLNFKKEFYFFFLISLISALIEIISIGSILPVIGLVTNDDFVEPSSKIFNFLLNFSPLNLLERDYEDNFKIIVSVCSLTLIIFIFRFLFQIYTEWVKANFIYRLEFTVANNLFNKIIRAPYTFHLKSNSANFHRDIQNNINYFSATANAFTVILIELLILLGLILFALKLQPVVTVSIILFLIFFSLIFLFFTNKINVRLGKELHDSSQKRVKSLIEGLGGIKEILMFNKIKKFSSLFEDANLKITLVKKKHTIINSLPRFIVEVILVIILVVAMLIIALSNESITENLTLIGFFTAIFLRLTPSAYRIISSIQRIKFTEKILKSLNEKILFFKKINSSRDFETLLKDSKNEFTLKENIIFKNINFSYDNKKLFNNLNFEILKGETVGIYGESGAGKSTFANILIGLLKPESGDVFINNNQSIFTQLTKWRKNIGYVPQNIFLLDESLKKNIAFGINEEIIDNKRIFDCLEQAELGRYIKSLDLGIETIVGERGNRISGGQLQRVGIARALYNDPQLLIFDESTSALDEETESEIFKNIYKFKKDKTLLIITHKKKLLKDCDKIYKLENGKLKNES